MIVVPFWINRLTSGLLKEQGAIWILLPYSPPFWYVKRPDKVLEEIAGSHPELQLYGEVMTNMRIAAYHPGLAFGLSGRLWFVIWLGGGQKVRRS